MVDWNMAENKIRQERLFLKNNLSLSPYTQHDPIRCNDCLFRMIAMLIVCGKIKVSKINFQSNILKSGNEKQRAKKLHGAEWHDSLINDISDYYGKKGYKTEFEPDLNFGRADLGIEKLKLFFEVGTINLYKLYINLLNLKNCKIVLIPNEEFLLKFSL